jgi:3-phosphoshikimate 1-carboxyvinyltransferase
MNLSLSRDTLAAGKPLGGVDLPGSKSATNRALLIAGLASGRSRIQGALEAEDTRWMREALVSLGIPVQRETGFWSVQGGSRPNPSGPIWLGASGTTLRFLLPWLAIRAAARVELRGEPRLFERPLGPLLDALEILGARWEPSPLGGHLSPAASQARLDLEVDGSLSSQFVSGLAMAAASLPGGGNLRWSKPVASSSYLVLTSRWLQAFGCGSNLQADRWNIPGDHLRASDVHIPADWSGAAAFLAAAAVTGREITVGFLDPQEEQRDRDMVAILESAGCRSRWDGSRLTLAGPLLGGIRADLEACPDLGPVLAATAALAPEPSVLTGLQTLPLKECDRLEASADLVEWLGGHAEVEGNHTLRIRPGAIPPEHRRPFDPRHDHRMAFASAVGSLRCGGSLKDPDCVAKTYPAFWDSWQQMLAGGA